MFSAGFFLSVMAAAMFPLRSVEGFPLSCFTITVADAVLIRVLMEQITGKKIIMPEVSGRIRKVQNRFETYLKTKNDRITSPEELTLLFTNESMISLMRDFAVKDPMQP